MRARTRMKSSKESNWRQRSGNWKQKLKMPKTGKENEATRRRMATTTKKKG